jgi:GNAT superfamily N-acetyltransferase
MGIEWSEEPDPQDCERVKKLVSNTGVFSQDEIECAGELVSDTLSGREVYYFLFARYGDSLAGYSCYGEVPLTESGFDLYWIAVDPSSKGTGLAAEILDKTEDAVRKRGGTHLYAETSSTPHYEAARRFYLKNGFIEAARLKDFYKKGDDKVIYSKAL